MDALGASFRRALLAVAASIGLTVSALTPAQAAELKLEAPVRISGIWAVGGTLQIADFNASKDVRAKYSWFIDGEMIGGATDSSLYLSANTQGRRVTAQVEYVQSSTGASTKVLVDENIKIYESTPTGGGRMNYGSQSIAIPGCFSPRATSTTKPRIGWPVTLTCQIYNTSYGFPSEQTYTWFRNGKQVDSSGSSSYVIQPADALARLNVFYRAVWPNGAVMTRSAEVDEKALPLAPISGVTIVGQVKAGATLTAKTSGADAKSELGYTWFVDYKIVPEQTTNTFVVAKEHLGKAIHVLVTEKLADHDYGTALSKPVASTKLPELDVRANSYQPIYSAIKPTQTQYDIKYTTSPLVTTEMLDKQKALLQRAADYWIPEFKPVGVQVLYFTESEGKWADDFIATQPGWSNGTGGTIQNRMKQSGCGFAIAFKANGRQVFIQCLSASQTDASYSQVGPHEYSHWVQYEIEQALFVRMPAWLVEGTANFYGLAIGVAEADNNLLVTNNSLAGHATQFDLGMRYRFASFKILDMFRAGATEDISVLLNRSGAVWEQYLMGSLVSEWLVWKFGSKTYFDWIKEVIDTRSGWDKTDYAPTHAIFKKYFGFEWSDLSRQMAPYLATRADQLQSAWAITSLTKIQAPKSTANGLKYEFPKFTGSNTLVQGESEGWLHQRLSNTGVRTVECVGYTAIKPTAAAKRLALSRANAVCQTANRIIVEQQRTPTTKVSLATTRDKNLMTQVEVTLK